MIPEQQRFFLGLALNLGKLRLECGFEDDRVPPTQFAGLFLSLGAFRISFGQHNDTTQ